MRKVIKTFLSIAGSDPCGGAGIQADIIAASSQGLHVATAITAVTSQNSNGFYELGLIQPSLLKSQLDAISQECDIAGIKVGLLPSAAQIDLVSSFIQDFTAPIPIVVDPVLKPTSSRQTFSDEQDYRTYLEKYVDSLFPLATVVMPNNEEISNFLDYFGKESLSALDIVDLGKHLLEWWGSEALIIKGGHTTSNELKDKLFYYHDNNINHISYNHQRQNCLNLHGTGCVMSSLLTAYLISGKTLTDAFSSTCEHMEKIIGNSCQYNAGKSLNGPLNINNFKLYDPHDQ
ncbi:MAG: hydroxymethylpyrimidine/phosphomethylpyrimidine kinase [Muribaculaceae bacterium]|nr:hydroxymethylpyrimidine/phosphomethylpyrimidine kinase [Muribaculaceae bacterium]